jgi:hypothetical protein
VNDDWRLQIDTGGAGGEMVERLASVELEHDLEQAFGETVIVSRDGDALFLYAGTREQAERAAGLLEKLAAEHGWKIGSTLTRWHPAAEEWQDPDAALPSSEAERQAEHEEAIADERAEVAADGEAIFEVRVEFDSHREAADFAKRLRDEGLPVTRRWKYMVVGATDEDAAKQLADRIRQEAPGDGEVTVEGSGQVAWAERPANPFAIFGGLGT